VISLSNADCSRIRRVLGRAGKSIGNVDLGLEIRCGGLVELRRVLLGTSEYAGPVAALP
jgi:hypothetical protein